VFRQLATWFEVQIGPTPTLPQFLTTQEQAANIVLDLHPMELSRFLEEAWNARANPAQTPVPAAPASLLGQEGDSGLARRLLSVPIDIYPFSGFVPAVWDHLIYAYVIENTRIYEIFRKVLFEYLHGERLGVATRPESQRWLRTTEELFYKDGPHFQVYSLTSSIRPDFSLTRLNAYDRLFGMALSHTQTGGQAAAPHKPEVANRSFVAMFEEFLREVWRGIENVTNVAGARPTDDAAIANLALQLQDMLVTRKQNGTLSREEFVAVSMMSWLHLTVQINSPIVVDLKADASSADQRLFTIGSRVGVPAHARSQSLFEMAPPMSRILRQLEAGQFSTVATVPVLYTPGPIGTPNQIREDMNSIISHWSIATGRDMKARQVTVSPRTPAPVPVAGPSANGRARAVSRETV
jgi:hypothetical protein